MGHDLYNNSLESPSSQYVNNLIRGDNILNLIFSPNNSLVSNVNTDPEFGSSDHKIVSFDINLEIYKENVSEEFIYIYRRDNFEK